ncbi:MAG: hypothetical protein JO131_03305, partial [Gammaproteobacteria bacterium]|nr:hypothetical protein [Gammaproteobacteria bacterium]
MQQRQDLREPFIPKTNPVDITDSEFDAEATRIAGRALSCVYENSIAGLRYVGNFLGKNLKELYPLAVRPATQTLTGFFTDDNGHWHGFNGQLFSDSLATIAAPFVITAETILPFGPNGFAMPLIPPFARAYQAITLFFNKSPVTEINNSSDEKLSVLEKISNNKKLIALSAASVATYGIFLGLGIMVRLLEKHSSELDILNPAALLENLQKVDPTWQHISLGIFTTLYTSTMGFILGKKSVSSAFEWNQSKWNKVEHDFFLREQHKFESLVNNPTELAKAHTSFIEAQKNKNNWKVVDVISRYGLETISEFSSSLLKASRKSLEDLTRVKWYLRQADILKQYAITKSSSIKNSIQVKKNTCITQLYGCFSWKKTPPADTKLPVPSAPLMAEDMKSIDSKASTLNSESSTLPTDIKHTTSTEPK